MASNELIEWIRGARNYHGTFEVAIPKPVTEKWKLHSGSTVSVILLENGDVLIRPSKAELDFQKKMEKVEGDTNGSN
jgi:antitoxin component of MazEF toxin-antitoxin module